MQEKQDNGLKEWILPQSSVLAWRVSLTVVHCLAIASALFRLYRRKITKRLWWDDTFAAGGLLLDFIYFPTLWLRRVYHVDHEESVKNKGVMITASWIAQIVFPLVLWSTRASLALSIARVVPARHILQRSCVVLACVFVCFGVGTSIQTTISCGWSHPDWMKAPPFQCPLQEEAVIIRIAMDFIADITLVTIPAGAFWRVSRLPPVSRRLIKACFWASLLVTVVGIGTSATLFTKNGSRSKEQQSQIPFLATVTSHLMVTMSIIVCNMLVVVTSIYRMLRANEIIKPIGAPDQPDAPGPAAVPIDSNVSASVNPGHATTNHRTTISDSSIRRHQQSTIPMSSIYSGHLTTVYIATCQSDDSNFRNDDNFKDVISEVPRTENRGDRSSSPI